eukprot:6415921-Karenia_brevis.AAC.1
MPELTGLNETDALSQHGIEVVTEKLDEKSGPSVGVVKVNGGTVVEAKIKEPRAGVAKACQGLSKAQCKITWKAYDDEVRLMRSSESGECDSRVN